MIFFYCTGIVTSGCSDPGFVPNALHSPRGGPYHEGSVVTYECNAGYVIQGSPLLHCLPNRQWSTSTPYCIRIPTGKDFNKFNKLDIKTRMHSSRMRTVRCQLSVLTP